MEQHSDANGDVIGESEAGGVWRHLCIDSGLCHVNMHRAAGLTYFGAEAEVEEASPDPTSQPTSDALHHASYLLLLLLGPATAMHAVATWMI